MEEAKQHHKKILGLETMGYQASVLDEIPYKMQAEQLVSYINDSNQGKDENKEFEDMMDAYREQDIDKLEKILNASDIGMSSYADVLLYKRNRNWVEKLKTLLPGKSLLIAVGAGHLPGEQGVIRLLRKAGYKVTAVENKTSHGETTI